ncbi:hypothetical protein KW797_00260 [Candidatus Parcubacteria bacterium]|nr:hypothetical protein [Candidatus Parcubacteria bacterium]
MPKQVYEYPTGTALATQIRKEVSDESDTAVEYMDDDSLLFKFNEFKRQIINAPYSGLTLDPEGRVVIQGNGRGFDFTEEDTAFDFVVKTATATALTKNYTGNCTLSDGSNFTDEPGAAILYDQRGAWDFVTYLTKVSPNVLGTLGNVDKAWASGVECHKLYPLPAEFARAKVLLVNDDELYEGPANPEDSIHFAIYKGFLWMPRDFGVASGTLRYNKLPSDMTSLDDTLDIPKELAPALTNMVKAWAFDLDGEEETLISRCYFAAASAINAALGYMTASSSKRIRLAREMPRSPTSMRGMRRSSNFDQGNGYN